MLALAYTTRLPNARASGGSMANIFQDTFSNYLDNPLLFF